MSTLMKKRHIRVENLTCSGCEQELAETVGALPGVKKVRANSSNGDVEVTYDLMQIELSDIEHVLREKGFPVKQSIAGRLKRNFIHFTEDNERDNQSVPPAPCCSLNGEPINKL